MTKQPELKACDMPEKIAQRIAERVANNFNTTVMYDAAWIVEDEIKNLAPTSQWRDIKDASHNEHWILACNDELSHSFTAAWSNRHQCFLDWNGDKIKVTQWKPIDAPPTKDLADAGKEKV